MTVLCAFGPEKASRNNADFSNHKFPTIIAYINSQGYIWVLLCFILGVASLYVGTRSTHTRNDCTVRKYMINTTNLPSTFNIMKPASCLMCQILFVDTECDD